MGRLRVSQEMNNLASQIENLMKKIQLAVETSGSRIIRVKVWDPKFPEVLSSIDYLAIYIIRQNRGRVFVGADAPERFIDRMDLMDYGVFIIDKHLKKNNYAYNPSIGRYVKQ